MAKQAINWLLYCSMQPGACAKSPMLSCISNYTLPHARRQASCDAMAHPSPPAATCCCSWCTAAGPSKSQGWISGVLPAKFKPANQGCPPGLTEATCKACLATKNPAKCYQCALKVRQTRLWWLQGTQRQAGNRRIIHQIMPSTAAAGQLPCMLGQVALHARHNPMDDPAVACLPWCTRM
jgi:hypothetical protein